MHGLIIQSSYEKNGSIDYSILTKNQVLDLEKKSISTDLFLVNFRNNPIYFFKNLNALKKRLKSTNYDFIHFQYGSLLGLLGVFVNHRNKIISICGSDILVFKQNLLKTYLVSLVTKVSLNFYNKIIVKSENLSLEISTKNRSRIRIIPNGVDIMKFYKKSYLKKKSFDILFHEGLKNKPIKNIELAEKTIGLLKNKIPNLSFNIISNIPHKQLPCILQNSDCLLLTSFHEGSPNIVKESLAVNTPVVSVDCGDVKQRLENANLGGVSKSYNEFELSELIYKIFISEIEFNGRELIFEQKLDSDSIAMRLKELYQN